MPGWLKNLISALIAGLITTLGGLMAVLTEMPEGSEIAHIGSVTWAVLIVSGVLTAAKDIQSILRKSS